MKRLTRSATAIVALAIGVAACSDSPTQPPAPPQPSITVSDADYALARSLPKLTPLAACNTFVDLVARLGRLSPSEITALRAAFQQFAGTRPTAGQVCAFLLRDPILGGLPLGLLRTKVERICGLLTAPRPPHGGDDDDDDDDDK